MSSTFGKIFTLSSFGESHGAGIGGVVDGCPSGVLIDLDFIQGELDKRKPGSALAKIAGTNRNESDTIKILSGTYDGKSTGTPIAFFLENQNHHSSDYNKLAQVYRPGHADITYDYKYGIRDPRGGGRSSARETAARVAGGAIAQLFLKTLGIEIYAYTLAIDDIFASKHGDLDIQNASKKTFCAPNEGVLSHWEKRISEVRNQKDTLGGLVRIEVHHVPVGLGEPVFHKLDAVLASAIMGVGAVKAVEIGDGFLCATSRGSKNNDSITVTNNGHIEFESNHAGGILGGISTGQNIIITAAVKPIPSIAQEQNTINIHKEPIKISIGGRHDICAIPRIVPVLAAMAALSIADMVLLQRRMQASQRAFSSNDTRIPHDK